MEGSSSHLVSVVIPYGGGTVNALRRQLRALLDQTVCGGLEVLVAANSPEAILEATELADEMRSEYIAIVDAIARRGPSAARNAGWYASSGSYVLFCDADDVVPASWIEDLSSTLDYADVAGTPLLLVAPHSRIPIKPVRIEVPVSKRPAVEFFPSCSIGFRRSVLEALNGWDEELQTCEDTDICYRAARQGFSLVSTSGPPVNYALREGFASVVKQNIAYGKGDNRFFRKHDLPTGATSINLAFLLRFGRDALLVFNPKNRRHFATRLGLMIGWLSR